MLDEASNAIDKELLVVTNEEVTAPHTVIV
jgi:hypothetical protein